MRLSRSLLMAVLVFGVLALAGFPMLRPSPGLAVKARVNDGLAMAGTVRSAVAAYWKAHGELPSSNAMASLAPPQALSSDAVQAIAVGAGGVVTITYAGEELPADAQRRTLRITPAVTADGLQWHCGGGDLPPEYRPPACR